MPCAGQILEAVVLPVLLSMPRITARNLDGDEMATVIADRVTPIEILLVEDSPGDVRLTQEARRDAKVQDILHVASDGIEATSFLWRQGKHAKAPRPDLIKTRTIGRFKGKGLPLGVPEALVA